MVKLWERIKMVRSRCIYFKVTVQTGHYHPDVTGVGSSRKHVQRSGELTVNCN